MGRWGWRLFEGDQDLDVAATIMKDLGIEENDWDFKIDATINQTDLLAGSEAHTYYKTPNFAQKLATTIIPYIRGKLDTDNLGDTLFAASKAKEATGSIDFFQTNKYRTIILVALMLRVGARVKEEHLQYVRDLVPQINCNSRHMLLADHGFRTPGRAQFLAALDYCKPGVPRNFQEASCFGCGKIEADLGHKPLICKKCKFATYCGQVCQREQWREHRVSCVAPEKRFMLNV
ncbi:hypothetical protein N7457_000908 [Penicillium paradoxum]|uniref:uncharacterized protein n=1 Tax=Penicillium paradoxum TaxID=176176 RepID=UPI0025467FE5|nr:uncharacterized protein N7457_000908 [Penicillium paradoxum]KAJ5794309.1 hypothetical protein N7457_000908 [Penicillium paradoxum]